MRAAKRNDPSVQHAHRLKLIPFYDSSASARMAFSGDLADKVCAKLDTLLPSRPRKGPMRRIRPITWLPLLAVAGPLLVSCAEPPKPAFVGPNGPTDELALQECRGEVAKAQVSGTAPADVRAEVAKGAMASCMAKKGFYPQ
jgi:hypothetical protein